MEAKELSVVLEGVDASPKCTAFGREVYSPLGGLAFVLLVYFSNNLHSICAFIEVQQNFRLINQTFSFKS